MEIDEINGKISVYTPIMAELIEKAELSRYTGKDREVFLFGLMQGYEACLKKLELIQVNYCISKYVISKIPDSKEQVKHELIRIMSLEIKKMIELEETDAFSPTTTTFTGKILVMPNNKKKHEQSILYK